MEETYGSRDNKTNRVYLLSWEELSLFHEGNRRQNFECSVNYFIYSNFLSQRGTYSRLFWFLFSSPNPAVSWIFYFYCLQIEPLEMANHFLAVVSASRHNSARLQRERAIILVALLLFHKDLW